MLKGNEKSHIGPRQVGRVKFTGQDQKKALAEQSVYGGYEDLKKLGIGLTPDGVAKMAEYAMQVGMDAALPAGVTTPSITTPVQFVQAWLPGFVEDVTDARKIDDLVGITTQGEWSDEEVVQGVMERTGNAAPYTDYGNAQMASWNVNYERRTIVRHELGLQVGRLEEARATAIRANSAEAKRAAVMRELEIVRNRIGFNGFNAGANRTYGLLNESQLPAYVNVPNGASSSSEWATKTFQEIKNDLLARAQALRTATGDLVDPTSANITVGIATSAFDYLNQATDFGVSVYEWIMKNYSNWRLISVPEFDAANGGDNVFYMYAEEIAESGTDDTRTFIQVVPTKFQTLGVQQNTKNYEEDYSNATAGIMLKRPYAVQRASGI